MLSPDQIIVKLSRDSKYSSRRVTKVTNIANKRELFVLIPPWHVDEVVYRALE